MEILSDTEGNSNSNQNRIKNKANKKRDQEIAELRRRLVASNAQSANIAQKLVALNAQN